MTNYRIASVEGNLRCGGSSVWSSPVSIYPSALLCEADFYPLLRRASVAADTWMFCIGEHGWPTSTVLPKIPETDEEKVQLIDTLQDWKTDKYQHIVCTLPLLRILISRWMA